MGAIGWQELLIVLVILLLLFGAKRLPGLANSMGKSIKEFRGATGMDEEGTGRGSDSAPQE